MEETTSTATEVSEERAANRARFELELEFVQALANPYYLHLLAQQNVLSQPTFINYLKYLTYWKEKEYARFIHYPHALHHLDLLQTAQFRTEIGKDGWRDFLNQKQYDHWRTWREDPKRFATQNKVNNEAEGPGAAEANADAMQE
ncbi:SOH1-domain-containing protein [Schizopora paradoxa]|uniref:Mediator of RNA polymerase II transcription subunit 31 n=1 Tax=Schizopora paradoxa TaxID=27342 RepID=A0A0H2R4U4_9AGAM|nr:SOH1-domain-containing protein [Schizopora paradoxa]